MRSYYKIHALTDDYGLTVKFVIATGNMNDAQAAAEPLASIHLSQMVLGDKVYDANCLRYHTSDRGGWANIPPSPYAKARYGSRRGFTKSAISSSDL